MPSLEWYDLVFGVTLFSLGAILYLGFPRLLEQLTRKMVIFDFERQLLDLYADRFIHALGICFCVMAGFFWLLTLATWRGLV